MTGNIFEPDRLIREMSFDQHLRYMLRRLHCCLSFPSDCTNNTTGPALNEYTALMWIMTIDTFCCIYNSHLFVVVPRRRVEYEIIFSNLFENLVFKKCLILSLELAIGGVLEEKVGGKFCG